jgi:hypothetical protein
MKSFKNSQQSTNIVMQLFTQKFGSKIKSCYSLGLLVDSTLQIKQNRR